MPDDLTRQATHVMMVCNACRYCEQYCPAFAALERRLFFQPADLTYLAHLCHDCGECLYACQFAPPHAYGVDVPRTFARLRQRSYEEYAWPRRLGAMVQRHGARTALLLAGAMTALLFAAVAAANPGALADAGTAGDFYRVVPHGVLVSLFGSVGLAVLAVLAVGTARCWRDLRASSVAGQGSSSDWSAAAGRALRDALTLRHLHASGADCATAEERRTPWRRWWHHCTSYGFALCFASTSVAALYHASGQSAPYPYTSLPVVLGTLGGIGLLIGPAGLWWVRRHRDRAHGAPGRGLDDSLLALLFLTSLTGLLVMLFRSHPSMGVLLLVHLGAVLALFLILPYGKFVHGLYRALALLTHWRESTEPDPGSGDVPPAL